MHSLAFIPARGGSKRLPGKNILPIGGKPMLAWPVATALASTVFDAVVVSSDDTDIQDAARAAEAEVHQRPAHLATDSCHELTACKHYLQHYLQTTEQAYDAVCILYPCAILLEPQDLQTSAKRFAETPEASCLLGVSPYPVHPYKALVETPQGFAQLLHPEGTQPSQTYPHCVGSNGTFYWLRADAISAGTASIYGKGLLTYEIPVERAVDIDTEADYQRAQKLFEAST